MRFLVAILFIISTVNCALDNIDREENVLVLNKDNFEEATTGTTILVEFYAPWCGHCKSLAPEYAKAATKLAEEKSDILLAKVDATKETALAEKYELRGYPTLKFFKNGKVIDYTGARTSEDIVKWLKKKTGPPALDLTSADDAQKFKDSQEVVVVAYFSDKESDDAKSYLEAAADNDETLFGITSDKSVADALEIPEGKVVLFKKFDEKRNQFDEEFKVENLKKFIALNSLPLVVEFSHENARSIFGGDIKNHNLLFINKKSDDYEKNIDIYRSAAKDFKGKVLFVIINTDDEEHVKFLEFFGLKEEDVPTMRLIKTEEEMTKYKPEQKDFTEQAIKDFVNGVLEGKIKQHLLSQDLPEDWDKNPVKVLVSDNFDSVAFDKSKDVLVEFYAPWCSHCKQLAPIYDQLGDKFKDNSEVLIAKMDATANELEHTKIVSYPTIKLFKRDTNEVIEYNGERTLDGLTEFIETGGNKGASPSMEVSF